MTSVTVLGAGSWGTVLAAVLAGADRPVRLWTRSPELAARMRAERRHELAAPGLTLPPAVLPTSDIAAALSGSRVVLFVLPSSAMSEVARHAAPAIAEDALLVSCAKGFEAQTRLRMTEVLALAVAGAQGRVAALSGPNLAGEIAAGQPAAAVVAARSPGVARAVQDALTGPRLRLYTSHDVVGVEYAGALKNCIAIAAGVADGLNMGVNARSALITRGLAEIARLGVAAGAQPLTFSGLAGMGDLIATCSSPRSRNYQVGLHLAAGRHWPEIGTLLGHVAEGVGTTTVARELAVEFGVRTPIIDGAFDLLFRRRPLQQALEDLMAAAPGDELAELTPNTP
ncbi:MAG TPA: NAD(P)H-dependent glycerol-3-phosphate dehydrogenase [Chloroflexota bacterium]|jgi:glycerol-3-phosphate dehydrogenase (NAD(P)+)|nr:NAD(P)H-dependent glycerol-3-phosphate dehydrogenase [Chloroflexota bacterium]